MQLCNLYNFTRFHFIIFVVGMLCSTPLSFFFYTQEYTNCITIINCFCFLIKCSSNILENCEISYLKILENTYFLFFQSWMNHVTHRLNRYVKTGEICEFLPTVYSIWRFKNSRNCAFYFLKLKLEVQINNFISVKLFHKMRFFGRKLELKSGFFPYLSTQKSDSGASWWEAPLTFRKHCQHRPLLICFICGVTI